MIAVELVSLGVVNSALVHPRETFRRAISEGACSIILAHNHPSGDVAPSDEDVTMTRTMHEAGKILGIEVVDHLVFSWKRYYSFRDNSTHGSKESR
jgi:DNA repair protein RadC